MLIFWNYISERYNIYKKKELLKKTPPWTKDKILSKYKFTNIFRELDPGTKYVLQMISSIEDPQDMIFNMIIYRLYNKIDTMNAVGIQTVAKFNRPVFEKSLRIQSKSTAIFTNAFTVSGYGFIKDESDKIGKTSKLIEWIHNDIATITNDLIENKNSQFTFNRLKEIKGLGNFLAYQIAVDIGYWRKDLFDESEFTVAGPGAKNGINRLIEDRNGRPYEDCIEILCEVQNDWFKRINVDPLKLFSDRDEPRLNLMSMENCLCEISKYLKTYYGEGRPRIRYYPMARRGMGSWEKLSRNRK